MGVFPRGFFYETFAVLFVLFIFTPIGAVNACLSPIWQH